MALSPVRASLLIVLLVTTIQVGFLTRSSAKLSPTFDEGGHLLAGFYLGEKGEASYYLVNPPFIKLLGFLAAKMAGTEFVIPPFRGKGASDWLGEFHSFMWLNRLELVEGLFWARLVTILFFGIAAIILWRWALELYGLEASYIAVLLWVFNPVVLGHSCLFTMDVPCATLSLLSAYLLHRYTLLPSLARLLSLSVVFGLAVTTKFTSVVFLPVMVGYVVLQCWKQRNLSCTRAACHALAAILVVVWIINAVYLYSKTPTRLGDLTFHSALFSGKATELDLLSWKYLTDGNRFRGSWLENVNLPIPRDFIQGLDEQIAHANVGLSSYMWGTWKKRGGWYYYYLYAFLVKTPFYLLGALFVFFGYCLRKVEQRSSVRPVEWLVWGGAAFFFLTVSLNKGINSHIRYILPALPFMFLGLSSFGQKCHRYVSRRCSRRVSVGVSLGCAVLVAFPAMAMHPHYLSYFNPAAGGYRHGWKHLVDSNLDWGQDLGYLKDWLAAHPEIDSIGLAYFGSIAPQIYGIKFRTAPPLLAIKDRMSRMRAFTEFGPKTGWFAISANFLAGMEVPMFDERGWFVAVPPGRYTYFQQVEPVAVVGSSIFVFHLTSKDVEAIRKKLNRSSTWYIFM